MSVQTAGGVSAAFPNLNRKARRALARAENRTEPAADSPDVAFRRAAESRLIGLRVNRFSFWVHWRELADYIIPRRYKWLITPNQMSRGSEINQHILDSSATLAARNLAAGLMMGCSDPTKRWFKYKIGNVDSTMPGPVANWLYSVERLILRIFAESNLYDSLAIFYLDLVIFGTAAMLVYEDFENVVYCINPCAGEYYLDIDRHYRPNIFAREFTMTSAQAADEFKVDNLSPSTAQLWGQGGTSLTRELVIAHMVEPNDDGRQFGIPEHLKYREIYWEWGGSASPQGGSSYSPGLLRKRGFHENPAICARWDLVSNDAYGRSPGMDALPDVKQLQLETKRLSQGIDKMVNPPMVADIQLKNAPASLLPGGITYVAGAAATGRPGFAPAYTVNPQVNEMMQQIQDVRGRISETFFNNLFQQISQYETRSNVTATEIDARRAEAMLMLGPVLERLNHECFAPLHERVFNIAMRAGIIPPAPREIQGLHMNVEFVSMIELAQNANQATGIERLFTLAGQTAAIDPAVVDNIDIDFGFDKLNYLYGNDPRLVRGPAKLKQIRDQRQQQQDQQQKLATMESMSKTAQNAAGAASQASQTDTGNGTNALQALTQGGQ